MHTHTLFSYQFVPIFYLVRIDPLDSLTLNLSSINAAKVGMSTITSFESYDKLYQIRNILRLWNIKEIVYPNLGRGKLAISIHVFKTLEPLQIVAANKVGDRGRKKEGTTINNGRPIFIIS